MPLIIRILTAYLNGENVVAISNNKMVTIDENKSIMYGMNNHEKATKVYNLSSPFIATCFLL